jgi:hypothetical protein
MLVHCTGNAVGRYQARIRERLIEVPEQAEYGIRGQISIGKPNGVVVGAIMSGGFQCHRCLIMCRIAEGHVERGNGPVSSASVGCHHKRGVDSATEQRGHWNIGNRLSPDRSEEELCRLLHELRPSERLVRLRGDRAEPQAPGT